jgi:hypothetical protein
MIGGGNMNEILNGHFFNPSRGNLTFDQVVREIFGYMLKMPEKSYELIVGCDSSSGEDPNFPLAVVILRRGEGGRFFLKKVRYPSSSKKRFSHWKTRILEEVMLSCQFALQLKENLEAKKQEGVPNYQFRYIHADIGENGATKDMIKEVTGLIRGNGFEPKIKPESYVASVVADRFS